ncbi:MAG TPA: methyltransferase domain-containing protein [Gammaproteobacteria bacterium]|nr:methyltransferase domain-containing protein [Gammaproteobacteria bacterium]
MQDMGQWFSSTLGKQVFNTQLAVMEQILPGYFGYHLLQMSIQDKPLFECSPIGHKFAIAPSDELPDADISEPDVPDHQLSGNQVAGQGFPDQIQSADKNSFVGTGQSLPFKDDSIDVMVIHHLLDFHSSPQRLLSEVARVSLPMGHLVIVGFNPMSTWGLWKPFGAIRNKAPWHGNFMRTGRLMDWLNLLNFKIDRAQYCTYGLPITRKPSSSAADYSQGLSRYTNWPFGAVYVIVARKQVSTMIPMKPVWTRRHAFGQLSVVPPAPPTAGRAISPRNLPTGG